MRISSWWPWRSRLTALADGHMARELAAGELAPLDTLDRADLTGDRPRGGRLETGCTHEQQDGQHGEDAGRRPADQPEQRMAEQQPEQQADPAVQARQPEQQASNRYPSPTHPASPQRPPGRCSVSTPAMARKN